MELHRRKDKCERMNYVKSFKELTTHELYTLLEMRSEVFVVEQNCVYQDVDGKDLESFHAFMLVEEEMTAYLRIVPSSISGMGSPSIGRVVVPIKFRGNGYAKELIRIAKKFIYNELHESSIEISAQVYLLDFYKSLDFVEVGERYLEDGIPHIKMVYNYNKK